MSPSNIPERERRGTPCPLCGAPATPQHAPFCSRGCRDRDLLNWLGEGYRIPARPTEADDGLDSAHEPPL